MSNYWDEVKNPPKTAQPPLTKVLVPTNEALIRRTNTAANTLWFVVAFSAINIALVHVQSPIWFIFGLQVAYVIDVVGRELGSIAPFVALVINVVLFGLVGFAGWRMKKFEAWAFIFGLSLVGVDVAAIIWVTTKTYDLPLFTLFVRIVITYLLWLGTKAAKLYRERRKTGDAI